MTVRITSKVPKGYIDRYTESSVDRRDVELTRVASPPGADASSTQAPPFAMDAASRDTRSMFDTSEDAISAVSANDLTAMETNMAFTTGEPDIFSYPSSGSLSDLESLFASSNALGWNDLFDPTMNFSMPVIQDQVYDDPLGLLAHVASRPEDANAELQWHSRSVMPTTFSHPHMMDTRATMPDPESTSIVRKEIDEVEVLEHAKVLLKHFRDAVIPQFAPLPTSSRSPWEVLNWGTAVQTHADMTFLQSSNVTHANKANLFAILGCSAHTITRTQCHPGTLTLEKGLQILDYASKAAKRHMQESLRAETSGSRKAKYKDQLMAIFSLVALAVCLTHFSSITTC